MKIKERSEDKGSSGQVGDTMGIKGEMRSIHLAAAEGSAVLTHLQ